MTSTGERAAGTVRAAPVGAGVERAPEIPDVLHDGALRGNAQVELRTLEGGRLDDDHGVGRRAADLLAVDEHLGRRQQLVDRAVADRPALVVPADHALHDRFAEPGLAGLPQWNAGGLQQADDFGARPDCRRPGVPCE